MRVERLATKHCQSLATRMRAADRVECLDNGHSALHALLSSTGQPSWACLDEDTSLPMAAFGFCPEWGSIWSLYADDLKSQHIRFLMGNAITAIRTMVLLAGCPLRNFVWEENDVALAWLSATHCFQIDAEEEKRVLLNNHRYIHFVTKPLGDLPHV